MFTPGMVLVALFVIPPIVAAFVIAGFRIELLKTSTITFNFPANVVRLTADSEFLASIPRTLVYGVGVTLLTLPLALLTAIVLNRSFRGSALMGIAVLLPWAVAGSVTGLFWKFLFESHYGLVTSIATVLGLTDHPIDWLFDTNLAVMIAIIATSWKSVPLFALLLLAALKSIPASLYRAAKMDGAGAWSCFRYVTLPGIRGLLLVVTVLIVINAFQTLDVLFTLTKGGPGSDTTTMIFYIYRAFTGQLSFGYGSTMAIFLGIIILSFAALLWIPRLRGRRSPVTGAQMDELMSPSTSRIRPGALRRSAAPDTLGRTDDWATTPRGFRLPTWAGRAATIATAVILTLWLVGPIVWIFISSVTPEGYITQTPPRLEAFSFDSYGKLLALPQVSWLGSAAVSLELTLATTAICIVLGAMAAYPLARLDVPGKGIVTAGIVITQTVPSIVVAIPTLLIFRAVGLNDTLGGLVLAETAFLLPLIVWLLKNVFEGVPRALESAARIDGCSRLGALFRITVPAAWPGVAAIIILSLIAIWNEFTFAVILGNKNTVTLTRLIGFIDGPGAAQGPPPFTVLAAAGIVAIAPCLVLVVLFHRRVVAGITEGFVKG